MIALCIEASHKRGLGHLFRTIAFCRFLKTVEEQFIIFLNDDRQACLILEQFSFPFEIVNLNDIESSWETNLIKKFGIKFWINDRLDTNLIHAKKVKNCGIILITFDDRGSGADLADIHFAPLVFKGRDLLKGRKVFSSPKYLVLNPEIDHFKRIRTCLNSLLVTLGGSDTYGVTLRVIEILKKMGKAATILVGPSFSHNQELETLIDEHFIIKRGVPSIFAEFALHDIAITGGGITPFEANASGLPCIVIANEPHEVEIGLFLDKVGSSIFAGYYSDIKENFFVGIKDIEQMSRKGMETFSSEGAANVYGEIKNV